MTQFKFGFDLIMQLHNLLPEMEMRRLSLSEVRAFELGKFTRNAWSLPGVKVFSQGCQNDGNS